jgi:wobble nucleotide-excising tRNase
VELVNAKMAAPLEALVPSAGFITAEAVWMATKAELEASAVGLVYANAQIDRVKVGNAAGDRIAVEANLAALRTGQRRHSEPVVILALNYKKLQDEKKSLVDDKDTKKAALDAYDETILSAYETDINVILRNFAAGFRLAKSAKNYVGKVPQSTYMLRFDTGDVDVTKAAENAPGFDTTMSAGDKNTFALAFFLAQLQRDSDLGKKLVVLDDPFTSLDDFRRGMTAKEIVRTGGKVEQTIVFSHDKHFLDTVKSLIHGVAICTMQISATSQGSSIEPWDIEWEVKEGYLQDHMRLQEYASGGPGDAGEMRKVMRPLLEQYIRYRFPNQWANNQWLGDMLAAVRADQTHPLTLQYDELDDINTYTATFHHNPNAPYNEDEVRAYAGRTAGVVGGC